MIMFSNFLIQNVFLRFNHFLVFLKSYCPNLFFSLTARRDAMMIIFLCHFHFENVYQGKMKRVCIQAKTDCAYQGKCIVPKLQNFAFYKS